MNKLEILINRLNKIEIKIEIISNFPWIYLHKINNIFVKEITFDSNHGFNIAYLTMNHKSDEYVLVNTTEMFKLIKKHKNEYKRISRTK